MKILLKASIFFTLSITMICTIFSTETYAKTFSDVAKTHYAYEAVQWAQKEKIVDGYGNGKFGPNDQVTEAQFAKMLANYFNLQSRSGSLGDVELANHWSNGVYRSLAAHGVPLNGYFELHLRNKPIKRGLVAHALDYLTGSHTNLYDAVDSMLQTGISTGQNPDAFEEPLYYFGYQNNLTRAQAVTFLYRTYEYWMDIDEDTRTAGYAPTIFLQKRSHLSLEERANQAISHIHRDLREGQNRFNTTLEDVQIFLSHAHGDLAALYSPANYQHSGFISWDPIDYNNAIYVKKGQFIDFVPAYSLQHETSITFFSLNETPIEEIIDENYIVIGNGEFLAEIQTTFTDTLYIPFITN